MAMALLGVTGVLSSMYFAVISFTSTGYGDIVPTHRVTKSLASNWCYVAPRVSHIGSLMEVTRSIPLTCRAAGFFALVAVILLSCLTSAVSEVAVC